MQKRGQDFVRKTGPMSSRRWVERVSRASDLGKCTPRAYCFAERFRQTSYTAYDFHIADEFLSSWLNTYVRDSQRHTSFTSSFQQGHMAAHVYGLVDVPRSIISIDYLAESRVRDR